MESKGYKVIRFANRDVFENPEGVARMILAAIGKDWS
jgi:very-short-patch-repair endonuclease